MKPIPVGYFRHHADSGWQQTSYRDLDEWRADLKNYADCDRDDVPPTPLYRYSELFDAAYGTPCQQVAWQQELERLRTENARLREALRSLAMPDENACLVCGASWPWKGPEHHAPGCLAAPKEAM